MGIPGLLPWLQQKGASRTVWDGKDVGLLLTQVLALLPTTPECGLNLNPLENPRAYSPPVPAINPGYLVIHTTESPPVPGNP